MGFKIREINKDAFEIALKDIATDSEKIKKDYLRAVRDVGKACVVGSLHRSKKTLRIRSKIAVERVHMKDDVVAQVREDKEFGGQEVVIKGGRRTGTLWHLVNDGTYRSQPTHFMDKAMSELDSKIDGIIDAVMSYNQ